MLNQVEKQQQTWSKTRMQEQLLFNVPPTKATNTATPIPNTDDESTVPENFIFFKRDGEKSTEPLWKPFKVPLLHKNGEQRYNENGKAIIIIAQDPKTLHSTVFLTNTEKHGEIKKARVVEMIGDYKKILEKDNDHA